MTEMPRILPTRFEVAIGLLRGGLALEVQFA